MFKTEVMEILSVLLANISKLNENGRNKQTDSNKFACLLVTCYAVDDRRLLTENLWAVVASCF
jgi:hypothetical protein